METERSENMSFINHQSYLQIAAALITNATDTPHEVNSNADLDHLTTE